MTRRAASVVLVAGLLGSVVLADASAQQVQTIRVTSSVGGDFGSSARVSKRSLEKYGEMLGLTDDQKSLAASLHEAYEAALTTSSKDFQSAREEMTRQFNDTQDETIWSEKMPKARKEHLDRSKALEKSLFQDIRSLLTTEQAAKWPGVEYARRRETMLRAGVGSGENVDLFNVVDGLKLPTKVRATLNEPLGEYELELDRALLARQSALDQAPTFTPGRAFSPDEMRDRLKRSREEGLKVKDINTRHARRIEGLLPDDSKAAFQKAVREATFPRIYRASPINKRIDAALGLADLSAEQRESLQSLRDSYQRDLSPANDRWASAVVEDERNGGNGGGAMAIAGGGVMQVNFGEDEKGPVAEARQARRDLDTRAREKLDSILSKDQRDRLPKESPQGEMMIGDWHGAVEGAMTAPIIIQKTEDAVQKR